MLKTKKSCCSLQGSGCIWGEGGRKGSHSAPEGIPRRRCGLWYGNSRLPACVMQPHWDSSIVDWPAAVVAALRWAGRTVAGLCGTSGRRCLCLLTWAPHYRSSFTPERQVGWTSDCKHSRRQIPPNLFWKRQIWSSSISFLGVLMLFVFYIIFYIMHMGTIPRIGKPNDLYVTGSFHLY